VKILVLSDRKSAEGNSSLLNTLLDLLMNADHDTQTITLNRGEIHPCIGCFGCWFKTPGQCVITGDNANDIARQEICSDAVILLSEITYGGFSADIKAFLDRSIQNILPYFEIYNNEMHHETRYEHFPIWISIGYGDINDAQASTFNRLAQRNALNLRPRKHLSLTVRCANDLKEAEQAILQVLEAGE